MPCAVERRAAPRQRSRGPVECAALPVLRQRPCDLCLGLREAVRRSGVACSRCLDPVYLSHPPAAMTRRECGLGCGGLSAGEPACMCTTGAAAERHACTVVCMHGSCVRPALNYDHVLHPSNQPWVSATSW